MLKVLVQKSSPSMKIMWAFDPRELRCGVEMPGMEPEDFRVFILSQTRTVLKSNPS